MKTTVELPEPVLIRAREYARERGKSFRDVLIEALDLLTLNGKTEPPVAGWESLFGAFAHEKEENARIQQVIDKEFSRVDAEDWK